MTDSSFSELRSKLDGSDSFMTGGHGLIKTAGATRHASRMTKVPVWALNDAQLRKLLLMVFPKLATDPGQRRRAAKWVKVIHLYFRVGWTSGKIAAELNSTVRHVDNVIYRIRRVAYGMTTRGEKRGVRPRGRPRINREGIPATFGSTTL